MVPKQTDPGRDDPFADRRMNHEDALVLQVVVLDAMPQKLPSSRYVVDLVEDEALGSAQVRKALQRSAQRNEDRKRPAQNSAASSFNHVSTLLPG